MKIKKILINIFLVLVVIVSVGLIFSDKIFDKAIEVKTEQYQKQFNNITYEDIEENLTKHANFDFDQVQSISNEAILNARKKKENANGEVLADDGTVLFNTVGSIAIPTVQIKLPIFLGVANENLLYGAGTAKENQKLGEGNYALASHQTFEPNLLFTPLHGISIDDPIYVTDKDTLYEYRTTSKFEVEPSQSEVIDDVKNKKMITLVTCNNVEGEKRLIVQGELHQTMSFSDIPEHIQQAFDIQSATF